MGVQDLTVQMVVIVVIGVFFASFMDAIAGGGGIISVPTYLLAAPGRSEHSNTFSPFLIRENWMCIPEPFASVFGFGINVACMPWRFAIVFTASLKVIILSAACSAGS